MIRVSDDIGCLNLDNIIYFTRQLGRTAFHSFRSLTEGVVLMSTYEEFMIILATASLIVAILNLTHKK